MIFQFLQGFLVCNRCYQRRLHILLHLVPIPLRHLYLQP
ncbi:unnamed protein product [Strongylus vulgaris]|uniref:Uncharacterized protein n=1 Tax=Strongylus vulgaris TaxID=40348 RepID=A0A3P7J2K6_STRVU|nr:unnamed protein product [Strongylus vulgaris]